ncbi:Non-essential glycogen phosphorylase [Curvularia kusanoi]|uniref:Non-essential glycogen phosphorylase n=1 Tax=Curvularia kusanoi TaxID=90978 RepID=A0A9P4W391_CURKU|nr:Non-essential glycogen phosphorylase [Curvularia kusanoi]
MLESPIYPHTLPERTIRLLTIDPGEPSSPLVCTLEETCLDTTQISYNALSYCWGANDFSLEIECNSYPLLITPNLHAALLEYRRRAVTTPLWVDAICINQSDIPERTAQVRMMRSVYTQAACVVVWLGESAATDEKALELLKMLNAPWATIKDSRGRDIPLFQGGNEADHDAYVAAQVPSSYFDALAVFLMRPWFSRVWIIQELASARRSQFWCGSATLGDDVPTLLACSRLGMMQNCYVRTQLGTVAMGEKEEGFNRMKLQCAGRLHALMLTKEMGLDGILPLLLITRYFDSTDPRDKIFALVGIANDINDEDFVDYSKDYQDLIGELSRHFLDGTIATRMDSAIGVLSFVTRTSDEELEGPSWILEVQGCFFDRIVDVVPSPVAMRELVPQSELLNRVPAFWDWYPKALACAFHDTDPDPDGLYLTGETMYEAFWRTCCGNRSSLGAMNLSKPNGSTAGETIYEVFRNNWPSLDMDIVPINDRSYKAHLELLNCQVLRFEVESRLQRWAKIAKWCIWGATTTCVSSLTYRFRKNKLLVVAIPFALPPMIRFVNTFIHLSLDHSVRLLNARYLQQSTEFQIEQRDFEQGMETVSKGRQFAVTSKGYIGWVPFIAKPGDSVGLFAGCRIPFVLRAFEDGYKLVGDTYMHGLMNGEGEQYEGEMIRIV